MSHGHAKRGQQGATYRTWKAMRGRCLRTTSDKFHRYGGRGISIDPKWDDYAAFLADMGERPSGTTLDRKDNDGPYSKENCVWVTQAAQNRNYSRNIHVEIGGVRKCLKDWCLELGRVYNTVLHRINRGWEPLAALEVGHDKTSSE